MRAIRNSIDHVTALMAQAQLQAEISNPEMPLLDLIWSSFAVSAFAGFATLLYSEDKVITLRSVSAAFLYTGVCGTTAALLLAGYGQTDPRVLLGVAGSIGIGAVSVVGLIRKIREGGGFRIELRQSGDDHDIHKEP